MEDSLLRSAFGVLRLHPRRTAVIVTLLAAAGASEGVGLIALFRALQQLDPAHRPALLAFALFIIGALALKAVLRWWAMSQVGAIVAEFGAAQRARLVRALLRARWQHLVGQPAGEIAVSIGREAFWGAYTYRNACSAIAAALQALVYIAAVFFISVPLGIGAVVAAALSAFPLRRWVRASRHTGALQTGRASALATRLVDTLHAIKPIKAMGRVAAFERRLIDDIDHLRTAETAQIRAIEALRSFQEPVLAVVVLAIGAVIVARDTGGLPALMVTALLLQRIVARAQTVQTELQATAGALGALNALEQTIRKTEQEAEQQHGGRVKVALQTSIALDDVVYSHGSRVILNHVHANFPVGSFVAIVGESGAGKTTLLDIIAGLRTPMRGSVIIDGVPINDVDRDAWHEMIGYVPQESSLLHDSLFDNIALGAPIETSDADRALAAVAGGEIAPLESALGERGLRISGGERRRIALARALAHRPRLLLLDEPTSEMDDATAFEIAQSLRSLRGGTTIIAVTHHPAMVDVADLVLELVDGKLSDSHRAARLLSRV